MLSDRDILLKGAKEKFLEFENPLLGYGPRTFRKVFPFLNQMHDKKAGSWHNDFIQIYFESGILGLTVFLALVVSFFFKGINYLRRSKEETIRKILLGIILAAGGLVLSALTAGFINSPVLSIVFAFLVAYLSALIQLDKSNLNLSN